MSRLVSRGRVALLGIVGLLLTVIAGTRVWASGTTNDAVLGTSQVSATGSVAVPGVVGLALVVMAALIAAMVTGRIVRRIVTVIGVAAAVGAVVLIARVIAAPADVLGTIAATAAGRTGSLEVATTLSAWAWVGLAGAAVLTLAAVAGVMGATRWPHPNKKYDAPVTRTAGTGHGVSDDHGAQTQAGPRGERTRTDWDALSQGHDPTDVPSGEST